MTKSEGGTPARDRKGRSGSPPTGRKRGGQRSGSSRYSSQGGSHSSSQSRGGRQGAGGGQQRHGGRRRDDGGERRASGERGKDRRGAGERAGERRTEGERGSRSRTEGERGGVRRGGGESRGQRRTGDQRRDERRASGERREGARPAGGQVGRGRKGNSAKGRSGGQRKKQGPRGDKPAPASPPRDLPDPAEVLDRRVLKDVEATADSKAPAALAYLTASALAYEAGDYEAAALHAQSAKRLAPRAASVREMLGLARYGEGEWAQAMSELRTYERLSGEKNHFPIVADCLRALGRPEKALELLDNQESESDPEPLKIEAEIVRAGVLHDQGKTREAIGALRRVLSEPKNVEYHHLRLWYLLAVLFEAADRPGEAGMLYARIADHDPEFLDVTGRVTG